MKARVKNYNRNKSTLVLSRKSESMKGYCTWKIWKSTVPGDYGREYG